MQIYTSSRFYRNVLSRFFLMLLICSKRASRNLFMRIMQANILLILKFSLATQKKLEYIFQTLSTVWIWQKATLMISWLANFSSTQKKLCMSWLMSLTALDKVDTHSLTSILSEGQMMGALMQCSAALKTYFQYLGLWTMLKVLLSNSMYQLPSLIIFLNFSKISYQRVSGQESESTSSSSLPSSSFFRLKFSARTSLQVSMNLLYRYLISRQGCETSIFYLASCWSSVRSFWSLQILALSTSTMLLIEITISLAVSR